MFYRKDATKNGTVSPARAGGDSKTWKMMWVDVQDH